MAKYDPTATVCKKKQIEVEKIDVLDIWTWGLSHSSWAHHIAACSQSVDSI